MKTKKITKKVLALFISVLMTVALLPIMAQAAISTGLDFQAGGPDEVLKPVLGAQDKNGWGYIAVKATGEGNNDNVICTSNDTAVATVEQNGKNGKLLHNPIFFIVNQFVPNGQYTKKVELLIRQHPRSRVWTP